VKTTVKTTQLSIEASMTLTEMKNSLNNSRYEIIKVLQPDNLKKLFMQTSHSTYLLNIAMVASDNH
jgi:hypothetical protein